MAPLIYVIEDDEHIRSLIKLTLESYSYNVCTFESAEEALVKITSEPPHLAIFDIMLPQMSGLSAIQLLRQNKAFKKLPIIVLTAKDSESDKITGLDSGADDYMTKPFSVFELSARVRSLLRRTLEDDLNEPTLFECEPLKVNLDTREVFVAEEMVPLTYKEFELLKYLISHHTRVVTREELLNTIWGYEFIGESRTLDSHIRSLRSKLGIASSFIKTIRGVGYRFDTKE